MLVNLWRRPIRVIIYGEHSQSWTAAVAPDANVWKKIPQVKEVVVHKIADGSLHVPASCSHKTILIPLMEPHIRNCPKKFYRAIPDDRSLSTFSNKAEFALYIDNQKLSKYSPLVFRNKDALPFPCVLKRVDLHSGQGVEIVNSLPHLQTLLNDSMWLEKPYLLQAYVSGQEYVTHCVCDQGRIVWTCTYRYEVPDLTIKRSGMAIEMRKVELPTAHRTVFEEFLLPVKYTGPCNIDYRVTPKGELVVLELNPRLGGSLMLHQNVEDLANALREIFKIAKPAKGLRS